MKYPEGESIGFMILKSNGKCICPVDTHRIELQQLRETPTTKITEDIDVVKLMKEMKDYEREHYKILHLDTKNRVVGIETISIGTLNSSLVHPREVVKGAILNNSNSVILIHNHPSGDCTPSPEDKNVATNLNNAFDLLGIKVLDHIVIGRECYSSNSCKKCEYNGNKGNSK